jgi:cation transporter-like permease
MIVVYLIGFIAGVLLFGFEKYIKKDDVKIFLWIVLMVCGLIGGVYSCATSDHNEWDKFDNYSVRPD